MEMKSEQDMNFCQSCGMPIETVEGYGTEADGSQSEYCKYCYTNGTFTDDTKDMTMQDMIDVCAPYMATEERTEAQAREMMGAFFPTLKRWKQ